MNYETGVREIYFNIFSESKINNNYFRFRFTNLTNNFYELAKKYFSIMDCDININICELSILFEYLYINQQIFFEIYEGNSQNEGLDLLCFLNMNIYLNKLINELLLKLDCKNIILELSESVKYIEFLDNSQGLINKIKLSLLDIFMKIIKKQFD
jgi:hypothetical protein